MRILPNYSLLNHNTFGIDVNANLFVEYDSSDELVDFIKSGQLKDQNFLHIGSGSNLLFLSDFKGVILHSALKYMKVEAENSYFVDVKVGSGIEWDDFVAFCVDKGWYGVENLSLIPGEVGASAVQNIGAYGVEVKDLIHSVTAVNVSTGEIVNFCNEDCQYDYRQSIFKNKLKGQYFITEVQFRLSVKPTFVLNYGHLKSEVEANGQPSLELVRNTIIEIRKSKLPDYRELGNAGSFFVNPLVQIQLAERIKEEYPSMPFYPIHSEFVKIPAGWLIEQAGWKGKTLGRAGVFKNQALVLVNLGGAQGADIQNLAHEIMNDVKTKFGISLSPEVNFII